MSAVFITHRRQQWPVGHGFFHTASIATDESDRTYRYVYDCGSTSRRLVEDRIERFSFNEDMEERDSNLDMLVLSHFHVDHINGVPQLLKEFEVRRLVLPYLSDDVALAALAGLAANGLEVWKEFSGLVLNPQQWLQERGRSDAQITRIEPTDGDGPTPQDAPSNNVLDADIDLPVGKVGHDVSATIGAEGQAFWDFRFYAHENWERYLLVLAALVDKFPTATEADLQGWLRDPAWIAAHHADVTDAFRSIGSSNQNGITLCMYSGPHHTRMHGGHVHWMARRFGLPHAWPDYDWHWRDNRVGWLATGDAELRDATLFRAFAHHYRSYRGSIDTLSIPHHGSRDNYCAALGDVGLRAMLTSDDLVDPKDHHPSSEVMLNLQTKCGPVAIVTSEWDTALFSAGKLVIR